MKRLLALAAFLFLGSPAAAQPAMSSIIQETTAFLVRDWVTDKDFSDYYPPQVVLINEGSTVYGACGDMIRGDDVDGSAYCPTHHTIYLVPEQLTVFYDAFGPSSVAYVIAHEFGHAIQNRYEIDLGHPNHELQADCLAGVLIRLGSESLGINRSDTIQMAQAAYNIGDPTHGTGAQRAYALMGGMGRVDMECSAEAIDLLASDKVSDPYYSELSATRSGTGSIDLSPTPFPKPFSGLGQALR